MGKGSGLTRCWDTAYTRPGMKKDPTKNGVSCSLRATSRVSRVWRWNFPLCAQIVRCKCMGWPSYL